MASAIIGGLTSQGHPASQIEVVEPWDQARAALHERFGIEAAATPGPPTGACGAHRLGC